MAFILQLLCIAAAFALPMCLIQAIREQDDAAASKNGAWACLLCAYIVFVLIASN